MKATALVLLLLCGLGGCDLSLGDYPYCYFCGNGEACPPGSSCGPNAYCLLPDGGEAGPADGGCQ